LPEKIPIVSPTLPDPTVLLPTLTDIFASGRVTVGPQVASLEQEVCRLTGATHTVAVSCGTSALMLIARALDLPPGGEVIIPSFTFAATAEAMLWAGLVPVLCDSEAESFTLDARAAETLITPRTCAICPVCVFGVPGDLDAYADLADRHRLALFYDTAQGLGGQYRGQGLGGFGRAEAFSMSPTKVVTALEGGLVTTNDGDLAGRLRYLRDYGKSPDPMEGMRWLGLSARMTEVNAAVARWSLARVEQWVANRQAIMEHYRKRLAGIPGVSFQVIPEWCRSARNYFVILLDPAEAPVSRDDLYHRLHQDHIETKRYFHPALHHQPAFQGRVRTPAALPVAERLAATSLALPMYSHMSLETVDAVCDRVLVHAYA